MSYINRQNDKSIRLKSHINELSLVMSVMCELCIVWVGKLLSVLMESYDKAVKVKLGTSM